jgi:membrane-associated protease RseP (regulator of RpoE activity)
MSSQAGAQSETARRAWALPLGLFVATVLSVFWTGAQLALEREPRTLSEVLTGAAFAVPLMAIFLSHEFGHYIAARRHGVPASLPHFLPFPVLSPFGTLGAVIGMPRQIRSRDALLDIGAAGPLAGLVVAIPVLCWGLAHSTVKELVPKSIMEGQSLLYALLKQAVLGTFPPGQDVYLHPTAFAGWAGLFLTMVNLVPWGQLDGGHIAYAWLGARHDRAAVYIRHTVLIFFVWNLLHFVPPVLMGTSAMTIGDAISCSQFWLVWFLLLTLMKRMSGETHPACDETPLSGPRRCVAALCLVLFGLLFMPTPFGWYAGPPPALVSPLAPAS